MTPRTEIAPYGVGCIPLHQLGERIHVVKHPAFGCPVPICDYLGPLQVYVTAVRWLCGHTRTLPAHDQSCHRTCHHNRVAFLAAKQAENRRRNAELRARRFTVVA
ncbi:hypothetical protein PV646_28470 [Streptomyces sp. ID05-26A]|nr:hypothetical protein [Streptomyces sp. ID05-26A]